MPTLLGLGTSYIYKFLDFMRYCVSKKLRRKWIKNTGLWLIRGGGYSLIWATQGCAAEQGMVFRPRCPKQGVEFWLAAVLNRVWYKEPRTFNPDCEQYLSFQSQKNLGWKGKRSCGAFFFLICIISTELNRPLPGHYSVINQHRSECYWP